MHFKPGLVLAGVTLLLGLTSMSAAAASVKTASGLGSGTALPFPTLPGGNNLFKISVSARDERTHSEVQTREYTSYKIENLVNHFIDIGEGRNHQFNNVTHWEDADISANATLRGLPVTIKVDVEYLANGDITRKLYFRFGNETKTFADLVQGHSKLQQHALSSGVAVQYSTQSIYNQLKSWLEGREGDYSVLKDMTNLFVKDTAIDPVAGNPNSYMATMAGNDISINQQLIMNGDPEGMDVFSANPSNAGYVAQTEVSDGDAGNTSTEKNNEQSFYLPLKYAHYFNKDNALIFDMPFNYNLTGKASTYSLSFGINIMHMLLRHGQWLWAATPHFHLGALVSVDLGAGTPLLDTGLGNRVVYNAAAGSWSAGFTNVFDYMQTISVKLGKIKTPYDLYNVTTQNGLDMQYHYNHTTNFGAYYTRFDVVAGRAWYIPGYNTIGLSFSKVAYYKSITNQEIAAYDRFTLSGGYVFGAKKYRGYKLDVGFNF